MPQIYGNWKILAPDGELLFVEKKRRADWYLDRNLADIVGKCTIKLKFEPKSRRNVDDLFSLTEKENKCVCCGTEDLSVLTKHHIVPSEYRKFFPLKIKSRNSHDIVVICRDCHNKYEEIYASAKRQQISEMFNIPLNDNKPHNIIKCVGDAKIIMKYGEYLPLTRYIMLIDRFALLSGIKTPVMNDLIDYVEKWEGWKPPSHAELVMKQVNSNDDTLFEFVKMWRKDFIDNMDPKFMPKYWSIDRDLLAFQ